MAMETVSALTSRKWACAGSQRNADCNAVVPFVPDGGTANGGLVVAAWAASVVLTKTGVTSPAPDHVYRCSWKTAGLTAGTGIQYTITGLTPGVTYLVRLHFGVPTGTVAAAIQQDIVLTGATTVTVADHEPTIPAGADGRASVLERSLAPTALGVITLDTFGSDTGKNAILSGFEVVSPDLVAESVPSRPTPSALTAATIPSRPTPTALTAETVASRPSPSAVTAASIPTRPTPTAPTWIT